MTAPIKMPHSAFVVRWKKYPIKRKTQSEAHSFLYKLVAKPSTRQKTQVRIRNLLICFLNQLNLLISIPKTSFILPQFFRLPYVCEAPNSHSLWKSCAMLLDYSITGQLLYTPEEAVLSSISGQIPTSSDRRTISESTSNGMASPNSQGHLTFSL